MSTQTTAEVPAWSLTEKTKAWLAHAITMSGLLWVLLAVEAFINGNYKVMWGWLLVALVVDAIDGPVARKVKVSEITPWFSGATMDIVIDYLSWTFLPAVFIAHVLPLGPRPLPVVAAALIAMSSMFCYANTHMKSSDWYFVGFPAAWNVIALLMWLLNTGVIINWITVLLFTVLAVIPWKWLHPFRVQQLRATNALAAIVWVASTSVLVYLYPDKPLWAWIPFWVSGLWIVGISVVRTWRDRPDS